MNEGSQRRKRGTPPVIAALTLLVTVTRAALPGFSLSSGPGLSKLIVSWHGVGAHSALLGSFEGTLTQQNGSFIYTGTFVVAEGGVRSSGTMSFEIVSINELLFSYQQSNGPAATNQVYKRFGSP
jgi:hypothetical protein